MGSLGKLSDFGSTTKSEPTPEIVAPSPPPQKKAPELETLISINIKITESHHQWIGETAKKVRRNNNQPIASGDRVYPQHLIGVAIELLKAANIDWEQVENLEKLKKALNLEE